MKTTKKLSALLLALCCLTVFVTQAFASEYQPMNEGTDHAAATLSITYMGQADCSVVVNARSMTYHVEVVMSLNQIGQPTPLKSWSASGTGRLSLGQNYYVSKGYDYQVTATITVKDSSGQLIESFSTTSAVIHY